MLVESIILSLVAGGSVASIMGFVYMHARAVKAEAELAVLKEGEKSMEEHIGRLQTVLAENGLALAPGAMQAGPPDMPWETLLADKQFRRVGPEGADDLLWVGIDDENHVTVVVDTKAPKTRRPNAPKRKYLAASIMTSGGVHDLIDALLETNAKTGG